MGKKATADEPEKLPSNTDVKKYMDNILKLRAQLREDSNATRQEIRDEYDAARNAGLDSKELKKAISTIEEEEKITEDSRRMVNIYRRKAGRTVYYYTVDEAATESVNSRKTA